MALKIYNSLSKQKELFTPITPGKINLYACGVTVYDYCHIGHARMYLAIDMATRYLRASGYEVNYAQNITDIDDKIIKRANENGESTQAVSERFTAAMKEDFAALNLLPPDLQPKATGYIAEMIAMVETLIEKEFAYVADNGDVLYAVNQFPNYGKLSHRNLSDLRAGARVEINEAKRDPLDFVLWKKAKPGEPSWTSPWGEGRPGWHLECSAMIKHCLGEPIDIHAGGMDLKFPHHENEIAQSEACCGHQFVNTWFHVGFLQINDEKMSKSLGNFFLIREALQRFSAEQIRYFMLATHYRKPVNYSEANLNNAQEALTRLYTALRGVTLLEPAKETTYEKAFREAMDDDFNTPEAFAILFSLAKEINKLKEHDNEQAGQLAGLLKYLANIIGLLNQDVETFFQSCNAQTTEVDHQLVEQLIKQREQARADKNWAVADDVRAQLSELGVVLEDGANGTTWRLE